MYPWVLPRYWGKVVFEGESSVFVEAAVCVATYLAESINHFINKSPLSHANQKHADHNFSKQPPAT